MTWWWWVLLVVGVATASVEGLIRPIDALGWPFIIGTILELAALAIALGSLLYDLLG
jgi:hypothetical protein